MRTPPRKNSIVLDMAQSINDTGQILAYGYDGTQQRVRHVVLKPVAAD